MNAHARFDAIGTAWDIETAAPLSPALRAEVDATIDGFDAAWSRFRSDSLVSRLARTGGAVAAPPDATAMLDMYAELSDATDDAVHPLVGAALEHHGYDADHSLRPRPGTVPVPPAWRDELTWSSEQVRTTGPVLIDVGALGKGRLVDRVADVVGRAVPGPLIVDAGGDMVLRGAPTRIGLEHPFDARRAIGVVEIATGAVAASAVNRRAWGRGLHHVIDGRTGMPVRTVAATWAFGDTAMRADAAATALFFDGGPALAYAWGVAWVRMLTDGRVERSPGCPAELFTRRGGSTVP